MFVKAYYTRSFRGAPTGGGRVTELIARPLLSLLFPKLADIVQPLGGKYTARSDVRSKFSLRRRLGRGTRVAHRSRRAVRDGRGSAGRPRRTRTPQPSPRRTRSSSARGDVDRVAPRRAVARGDGALRRVAYARAGRNRCRGAGRGARARTDRHGAGVPTAFLAASIAASSTSNAAREYVSLDCQTAIGERENLNARLLGECTRARRRSPGPRRSRRGRPRARPPMRAHRRRLCPRGSTRRACPRPSSRDQRPETRLRVRPLPRPLRNPAPSSAPIAASPPASPPAAPAPVSWRDVDAGAGPVLLGQHLQPAASEATPARRSHPSADRRRSPRRQRRSRRRTRPSPSCLATTNRALRPRRARRRSSHFPRPRRRHD